MEINKYPIIKDLVLVGGGHSHVAVLKKFGMNPMPGVRITLITRDVHTPYSGMLPGYIAGHYDFDSVHVDLRPLVQFCGGRLFHDEVIGLDFKNKRVVCKNRPPVIFDLLSINIGSSPENMLVPGAKEFTVPVKPISRFLNHWNVLLERILEQSTPCRIGIVGGGAGGVEILLAIQFKLQQALRQKGLGVKKLEFYLISKSERILPGFSPRVSKKFERILKARAVKLFCGIEVKEVINDRLVLSNAEVLQLDEILWVTGASAPNWIKDTGLKITNHGFISVANTLQSVSHSNVFATGDIADVRNFLRPKAGVFAVRQGAPLFKNLCRVLQNKSPKPYYPQKSSLALISTGDKFAIAARSFFELEGGIIWKWKDWIDRRWMKKYSSFPEMKEKKQNNEISLVTEIGQLKEISTIAMRCGGCGAKVGANALNRALEELKPFSRDEILIGLHEPDDAAVVEVKNDCAIVHSVDYFRSFIDDPYIFGKVAANHSLSDIFAMGAEAQSALAIATVPYGIESKVEDTIKQMMSGALQILNEAKTSLVGGHTSEGAELALGFSVNGIISRNKILRKGGMLPGDILILTKGLGTGTLFAADMQKKAKGRWIKGALDSMIQSNRIAADCLHSSGATACTDITGFGLLGHLVEMIRPSNVDVELNMTSLPILDGAMETISMGVMSTLQPSNLRLRRAVQNIEDVQKNLLYPLIFDPQTSGGLLASIPQARAEECLKKLKAEGYVASSIIGRVKEKSESLAPVMLTL